jgi:hypothetical protein
MSEAERRGWFRRWRGGGAETPDEVEPGAPADVAQVDQTATATEPRQGWYRRLRAGLSRSSSRLKDNIASAFTKRRLDAESLEELEEILIQADLGVETSAELVAEFGRTRFGKEVSEQEVRGALAGSIARILEPVARPLAINAASTAPARPRPSASSRGSSASRVSGSCSRPATRFGPRRSSSSRSGVSARAARW